MADDAWMIDVAHALGRHATPAFFTALALLMTMTALTWHTLQRTAPRWSPALERLPTMGLLLLGMGGGFVVIAAAGAVFAEMTEAMDAEDELGRLDEALTSSLRDSVSPLVLRGFALLTRLGDAATLITLAVAVALWLLWRGRRWLALGWCVALAGNGVLNPLLKSVFERARPEHEHRLVTAAGYSFPSGHSSGAVVSYGMLAYVLLRTLSPRWQLPMLLAATALVFGIACSRVFLQVHWPSDVLAGLASGTAWLVVCVLSIEALRGSRQTAAVSS